MFRAPIHTACSDKEATTRRPPPSTKDSELWKDSNYEVRDPRIGSDRHTLRADMVILAIPFDAVPDAVKGIDWDGRIVVDATNAIDFPAFTPRDLKGRLSTEIVAGAVPGARVVKAFNTLPAAILGADAAVSGGRRVLFVSSDDRSARLAVIDLVERIGFAAVDLGGITKGGRAQEFGGGVATKNFIQLG